MQSGSNDKAGQPEQPKVPGVPQISQPQVPARQPQTSSASPRPYSYPQMLAAGAMQPGVYQQQQPNIQNVRPVAQQQTVAAYNVPHSQAQRPTHSLSQPANASSYLPQAQAPMGMQAAIDLLAQGQRAYANRPQQMQYAQPQARPLTGLPGRPTGVSAKQANPSQPTRKYNKKRKTPDTTSLAPPLPRTAALVPARMPESPLYTELLGIHDGIMKAMVAQKQEVKWALSPQEHIKKKLRVYVYSDHYNQPHSKEFDSREPSSWTVTVWGKLMDAQSGASLFGPKPYSGVAHKARPFSYYLKSVKLRSSDVVGSSTQHETAARSSENRTEQNGNAMPVWEKDNSAEEARDRFQIRQSCSTEKEVQIEIQVDSQPPIFEVEEKLAALTGLKQAPRSAILHSLFSYIKSHDLQASNDEVIADKKLQDVLVVETFNLSELPSLLEKHLSPQVPYSIPFTIRPSAGARSPISCFDLDLYVAAKPEDRQSAPMLEQIQSDPEIEQLQAKINGLIGAATEKARRRKLLLGFAADPNAFIDGLVAMQARDIRTTPRSNVAKAMRRTELFQAKWVENAVLRYLHRKLAAGG